MPLYLSGTVEDTLRLLSSLLGKTIHILLHCKKLSLLVTQPKFEPRTPEGITRPCVFVCSTLTTSLFDIYWVYATYANLSSQRKNTFLTHTE